ARRIGLLGAMGTRILLLLSISWIANLTNPFITILGRGISGRDVILIGGGLLLLAKATYEIHDKLEGEVPGKARHAASFANVILRVLLLYIFFSLVPVFPAVGLANFLWVMVTAIVLAVFVMMLAPEPISRFVEVHPTIKILALSFLLLIGISLIGEGLGQHIDKRYIYFAMGFSVFVEMINIRIRGKGPAV